MQSRLYGGINENQSCASNELMAFLKSRVDWMLLTYQIRDVNGILLTPSISE